MQQATAMRSRDRYCVGAQEPPTTWSSDHSCRLHLFPHFDTEPSWPLTSRHRPPLLSEGTTSASDVLLPRDSAVSLPIAARTVWTRIHPCPLVWGDAGESERGVRLPVLINTVFGRQRRIWTGPAMQPRSESHTDRSCRQTTGC